MNGNDGPSDADEPGQPGVISQHKDRLSVVLGKISRAGKALSLTMKRPVLSCGKSATSRDRDDTGSVRRSHNYVAATR